MLEGYVNTMIEENIDWKYYSNTRVSSFGADAVMLNDIYDKRINTPT